MREEASLLGAIVAGDDTARLAYADWLEERGDPRAEWVRDPAVCAWMLPDGHDPTEAVLAAAADVAHPRRDEARAVAGKLGAGAVPGLLKIIGVGGYVYWAGEAISGMTCEAVEPSLPGILELLDRSGTDVCLAAMLALKPLGPAAAPALPRLIALLPPEDDDDWDFEEGGAVCEAVACLGPAALPAVPALLRLHDTYRGILGRVVVAIGPAAVPTLLAEIGRRAVAGGDACNAALQALRTLAPEVLPALRSALRDENVAVREAAALALASHEPAAAMPVLLETLETLRDEWRKAARLADAVEEFAAFAPPPTDLLERILPVLHDPASATIAALLQRLGEGGGAVRILCGLLAHPDAGRRAGAVAALGNLDPLPDDALATLIPMLNDGDMQVRGEVHYVLKGAAISLREGVRPAILAAVHSSHRDDAIWALERMADWGTPEGWAGVRGGLSAAAPEVRKYAVVLLRSRPEADALLQALIDDVPPVRAEAAVALAEAGPSDAVTAALRAALDDKWHRVRTAALRSATVRGEAFADEARWIAATDPVAEVRQAALDLIALDGPPDAAAFLRAQLADADCAATAAHRLADLAEAGAVIVEAAPDLARLLPGPAGAAASRALAAIGRLAVPALVGVLNGADVAARWEACQALTEIGEQAAGAVEALVAVLDAEDADLREEAAKALAVCATPATPADGLRRLLTGQGANTTEYALTALIRVGPGGASWADCSHLIDHATDDVAACVVWAAGSLLPEGEARGLWRGWLASPRDCVKRAAHLELFRAGLMEAPATEDLFAAGMVVGLRPWLADLIAARAEGAEQAFRDVLSAATRSPYGYHGTAVEVLRRVGRRDADLSADALDSAFDTCTQPDWCRLVLRALAVVGPAVPSRVLPRLRDLITSDNPGDRGLALALMRCIVRGADA